MDWLPPALLALAWWLGVGAVFTCLGALLAWWRLSRLALLVRTGRMTGRTAFHRFRLIRVYCALLVLVPLVVLPLAVPTLLFDSQSSLALQIIVESVAVLGWAAVFSLLMARLLVPRAWARLIGTPFQTPLYVAAVARTLLLSTLPLLVFVIALCACYQIGLPALRWLLPLAAAGWVTITTLNSSRLRAWMTGAAPIEQTPFAGQAERIHAWARLAGVQLRAILVDSIADGNADNALVAGPREPTMFLGAEMLAHTDWRQRDAVIGHELGHARMGHLYTNMLVAILRVLLLTSIVVGLVPVFQAFVSGTAPGSDSGDPTSLVLGTLAPLLLLGGLAILSFLGRLDQRRRHRMELACDRFSAMLTGDPLAMAVLLHTITVLAGLPLRQRSQTHPTLNQRVATILQALYVAGPRAPWAFQPVPSDIPFGTPQTSYTVPMDQEPAPAPVQRAPVRPAILPAPMPTMLLPAPYTPAVPVPGHAPTPQPAPGYAPAYGTSAPPPYPYPYPYPSPYAYPYAPPYGYPPQSPAPVPMPTPYAGVPPVAQPPEPAPTPSQARAPMDDTAATPDAFASDQTSGQE